MLQLLLPLLGQVLPEVIKRVLPGEKISEADQARLNHELTQELLKQDWKVIETEFADRASARDLAAKDVEHGNAFSTFLAAVVRPAWGLTALAVFLWYGFHPESTMPGPIYDLIQYTIWFYFGGRVAEKVVVGTMERLKR